MTMVLNKELIEQFIGITGCDEITAVHMLEAYNHNLQSAVSEFLDGNIQTNGLCKKVNIPKDDDVREPIPQTQGVLVEDYTSTSKWFPRRDRSVFGTLYNADEAEPNNGGDQKLKKLEDLFRPPVDIMHRGTFQSARDEGVERKKWLIVNIQNVREFVCQALNRDVWSNKKVKNLIKEHFIFWQEYSDSTEGERFMNFYSVAKWPQISIIDPRTGGRLTNITDTKPETLIETIHIFLANHGSLDEDKPTVCFSKSDILNSNEDAQLAAAIAASLEDKISVSESTDEASDFESALSSTGEDKEDEDVVDVTDPGNHVNNKLKESHDSQTSQNSTPLPKKTLTKIFPKKRKLDQSRSPFILPSSSNSKKSRRTFDQKFSVLENAAQYNGIPRSPSPHRAKCQLLLKYPDGLREKISMNADDTIKDLIHVVATKSYSEETYELVTNFPRKQISNMPGNMTLRKAGLYPEETIFIQEQL